MNATYIFDLTYNLNSIENSIFKRKILQDLSLPEPICELNKEKKHIKEEKETNPYKKEELELLMNFLVEQYHLNELKIKEEYKDLIWSLEIPLLKDKYEIANFTFNVLYEIHLQQKLPSWITSHSQKLCKLVSLYHLIMKIIPTISLKNGFRLQQSHVMKITQFLNNSDFVKSLNSSIRIVLIERFTKLKSACMFQPKIPKENKKLLMKKDNGIKKQHKMKKKL